MPVMLLSVCCDAAAGRYNSPHCVFVTAWHLDVTGR